MKILMVCLGNICRSPLAHGILQDMVTKRGLDWEIDSAGTNGFHDGELPDSRSVAVARDHGIDITYQRSRQITSADLDYYDRIYVMDASNYQNVLRLMTTDEQRTKLEMLLNMSHPNENRVVPDPYYHGGFESVYQMITEACEAIVERYG